MHSRLVSAYSWLISAYSWLISAYSRLLSAYFSCRFRQRTLHPARDPNDIKKYEAPLPKEQENKLTGGGALSDLLIDNLIDNLIDILIGN